jgi:hypothetical protein
MYVSCPEQARVAAAMPRLEIPSDLNPSASLPDDARVERGQLAAEVAVLSVLCVGVGGSGTALALARQHAARGAAPSRTPAWRWFSLATSCTRPQRSRGGASGRPDEERLT